MTFRISEESCSGQQTEGNSHNIVVTDQDGDYNYENEEFYTEVTGDEEDPNEEEVDEEDVSF